MANNFNENTRVQVPATIHLWRLGYEYLDEIKDSDYEHDTNILTGVFRRAFVRLNPGSDDSGANDMLLKIVQSANNDDLGREFYNIMSQNSGVRLIDFDNPDNNYWHITTEFTCRNDEQNDEFRPDITCFVNGLPLVFVEVKKPNNHDGIIAERNRINYRFKDRNFRRFVNITQLMIFSNNQEYDNDNRVPIQGAFYCCRAREKAFFSAFREENRDFVANYPYRDIDEEVERRILTHRNCVVIKSLPEYQTNKNPNSPTNRILTSMLSKERILFLLRYGFAYVNKQYKNRKTGEIRYELQKHVMRYQQFFASLALRRNIDAGVRSGIIWHTQGSGKTALTYYSVKSLTDFLAKKNVVAKFYFIVDRLDLMEQACNEFGERGLLVRTAQDRKSLMEDIRSTEIVHNNEGKLEIMVVNIQKFKDDPAPVNIGNGYNTNLQRLFFIDEAHRGYDSKGKFLANLLDADRDSIKIALTGTPLLREERESWRVFGNYLHRYYYDRSIADGYTLKLMREPIETSYKQKLDDVIKDIQVKRKDLNLGQVLETPQYLNALIDFIVEDFRTFRIQMADDTVGAMIVCRTNPQARKLYELWQERVARGEKVNKRQEENFLSGASEPMAEFHTKKIFHASLILHDEGDKSDRKEIVESYKYDNEPDFLIVNEMLLTGFDAPRLKRLYLGRSLDGHNLLQALTRVNRPYNDFRYGYVVDFVDIKENFENTNDRYLRELARTDSDDEPDENGEPKPLPIGSQVIENVEEIKQQIADFKTVLWNFTCDNKEEFRKEIDDIESREDLYELRHALTNAKGIINQIKSFGDDDLKARIKDLPASTIPSLITEVNHRIERINYVQNTDHKADVAGMVNVILSEMEFEFRKGIPEELQIIINDLKERCEKVQREFEANFDQKEDKYVSLAEEFRKYFREHGFTPKSKKEARESIGYMDEVMRKIKEINRRNNLLKRKYRNDERFVRIHKRIEEENVHRDPPLISKVEYEICENLLKMKLSIDQIVYDDVNIVSQEDVFSQDVLRSVSVELLNSNVKASIADRKYITNLIAGEYFLQYNPSYIY